MGQVAVSPETIKALILVRDMYVANLKGFEERLWAIIHLPANQRLEIAHALTPKASELNSAYTAMWHAWRDSADIHDKWEKQYESYINQAKRFEKLGNQEKAADLRAKARETRWGSYLDRRAEFYRLLSENPLLGLSRNGRYLFQALMHDTNFLESSLPLFDRYLHASQQQVAVEIEAAANTWNIKDLWKFGGPRFRRQQEAVALIGEQVGLKTPRQLMGGLRNVYRGYALQNGLAIGLEEAATDISLGVLAIASFFIPVVGPYVSGVIGLGAIGLEGSRYHDASEEVRETRIGGPVTGFEALIDPEGKLRDRELRLLLATVFSALDISAGYSAIKAHVNATTALRTGAGVGEVVESASEIAARVSYRPGNVAELAEAINIARKSGVSEDVIEEIINHTLNVQSKEQIGLTIGNLLDSIGVGAVHNQLVIATANAEGVTIVVHRSARSAEEVAEFGRFAGGVQPRIYRELDLTTAYLAKAKAQGPTASGWSQELIDFVKREILPLDDAALARLFEFSSEEGGLIRLFTDEDIRNVRNLFRGGGPEAVPTPPRAPSSGTPSGPDLPTGGTPPLKPSGFDSGLDTNIGPRVESRNGFRTEVVDVPFIFTGHVDNFGPTVLGQPGPGVSAAHIRALQEAADGTGEVLVIFGSRQTGIKHRTGRAFDSSSDLDIGVVGDMESLRRVIRADLENRVLDVLHLPIWRFNSEAEALERGFVIIRLRSGSNVARFPESRVSDIPEVRVPYAVEKSRGEIRLPTAERNATPELTLEAPNDAWLQRATEVIRTPGMKSFTAVERAALRSRNRAMIEALEAGEDVHIFNRTTGLRQLMADITAATGREVALLRVSRGELGRVLRLGTERSVGFSGALRVIAHTHPSGQLTLSLNPQFIDGRWVLSGDVPALMALESVGRAGQVVTPRSSVVIGPSGAAARFPVTGLE